MKIIRHLNVATDVSIARKLRNRIEFSAIARAGNLVIAALAILAAFGWLQFSTQSICCGDFDGYYHMAWARMLWDGIRAGHFPPAFTWLPLTTLNPGDYVDHHLFYHLLLIPFTWFGDLRLGGKISAIIFASLAVLSCYWLIVRYRIRYSLVWLIALLACSAPFLFRLNMTKAPPLAIIYLVIAIYLLFERKYWPLLPLAFVFALTYDMFVLLCVAVVIWTAVIAWTEQRFEWRPLVWVCAGSLLGLVINPYFPHNFYLLYEHARIKIKAGDFATKVGQEWYPYDTYEFVLNCFVALAAMLTGYLAFEARDRQRSQRPLFFLIFSTALMLMTARWKRFAEYFPPFAVLFAAFSLQQFWLGRSVFGLLPDEVMEDLQPFLDRGESSEIAAATRERQYWSLFGAGFVAMLLLILFSVNMQRTAKDIAASDSRDYYAAGAAWMRAHIPANETVFNTDWDDFPRLFYYDPQHAYVSGLDPNYLFDRDPHLSELYDRITTGKEEDPGPLIRNRFGSRWVFSDNTDDHADFFDQALRSGWFERVYQDADCSVLRILDQKGEPPPEFKSDDDSP
jgi:hypothetical protein